MNFQWQYGFGPMSLNCTPHFKFDTEKSWVTKESASSLHYWFNPEKGVTLLEVVEQIEGWTHHDFEETLQINPGPLPVCGSGYNMNILSMEIRGVKYNREDLATMTTNDNLHNEEPFTLRFRGMRGGPCVIL